MSIGGNPEQLYREPHSVPVNLESFLDIHHERKTAVVKIEEKGDDLINPGDVIKFTSSGLKTCLADVVTIRKYSSVTAMLEGEDLNKIFPNKSKSEAEQEAIRLFSHNKDRELIVIEFKKHK